MSVFVPYFTSQDGLILFYTHESAHIFSHFWSSYIPGKYMGGIFLLSLIGEM